MSVQAGAAATIPSVTYYAAVLIVEPVALTDHKKLLTLQYVSFSSWVKSCDLILAYEIEGSATNWDFTSVFENIAKANIFSKYDGLFFERAEMYRIAAKNRRVKVPWNIRK